MLFRKYVSNNAAGRGKALLAALELTPAEIARVYGSIDKSEIEAVQAGLLKWQERASVPTWAVLLEAMDQSGFAKEHCKGLEKRVTGKE